MSVLFLLFVSLFSAPARAGYDGHWHEANFWSGAFPDGFTVLGKGVSVRGREAMDPAAPANVRCELPRGAVFHPWNAKHGTLFVSESRIVPMVAKEAVSVGEGRDMVTLHAGDKLDYLVYQSNGLFMVRYHGKQYQADASILDKMSYDQEKLDQPQDEWLKVKCKNNRTAWLFLSEIHHVDEEGNDSYLPGLGSPSRALRAENSGAAAPENSVSRKN